MNNFKSMREKAGITQREAAQILGVAARTYQDWELGNRTPKNPEEISETLRALGILNREAILEILNEESDYDVTWALNELKRQDTEKLSKWGAYGNTFQKNWERVPYEVREKLNANELAMLIDAIKKAYDDGYQAKAKGEQV